MKYKGYTGIVELDEESRVLSGRVIGLRDVITFEGDTVSEVIQAFHDSVDDYLEFCAERGESPEKPYSGQFVLRLDPRLHRELAITAEAGTVSLNALIESVLSTTFPLSKPDYPLKTAAVPRRITTSRKPDSSKEGKQADPGAIVGQHGGKSGKGGTGLKSGGKGEGGGNRSDSARRKDVKKK
jgi:predicted HicB family RNase H-like nuclease